MHQLDTVILDILERYPNGIGLRDLVEQVHELNLSECNENIITARISCLNKEGKIYRLPSDIYCLPKFRRVSQRSRNNFSKMSAEDILRDVFGFSDFRPGQKDVIDEILAGRDVLVVMATGAGKSLCYQIPALMSDFRTVIVSPLIALMNNQVAGLRNLGISVEKIHSGMERRDKVDAWLRFKNGDSKTLYISPEGLMTPRMTAALQAVGVGMFVVDEAHCISQWGVNFRPDYAALSNLSSLFPDAIIAAFTATADEVTRNDISKKLTNGKAKIHVHRFERPNLFLAVNEKTNWKKQLLSFLENKRGQSGVVYCRSRKLTEEAAEFLHDHDYPAISYHAGQDAETRTDKEDRFMTETGVVMTATVAFGMGIDKPDIRYVVHLSLPSNMETYYQEIGRAGRDGAPAEAFMIYGLDDINWRLKCINEDGDDEEHKRRQHNRLRALLAYCDAVTCRRKALLAYFGEHISNCGHCDNCINPPKLIDGTEQARVLLGTIYQTGQVFGAVHVIDVVRGSKNARIIERGHSRLDVYAQGAEYPVKFWRGFIHQMLSAGHITRNIEKGGLQITDTGFAILRDGADFQFKEIISRPADVRKESPVARVKASTVDMSPDDLALLDHLKKLRSDSARKQGVPAFVIFHDATLIEMVIKKPLNIEDMSRINGVGPRKLELYGRAFLDAIRAFLDSISPPLP